MHFSDLNDLFGKAVAEFPTRPALADEERKLSYTELDAAVSAAAEKLAARGIGTGSVVALKVQPSVEVIVSLLAILRSGACYLSLDPSGPAERAQVILDDARPCAIVEAADGEMGAGAVPFTETTMLRALDWAEPAPALGTAEDPLAYIIYTSGTTGKPKGVPVTHRNVAALFADAAEHYDFGPEDRWLLFHSTAFDMSVWEMWGALLHGGCLYVPDRWTILDPTVLAAVVRDEQITVLNQTPTAFSGLAPELIPYAGELSVRYVVFGGERLLPATLRPWTEVFPCDRVALINMYGITEVTVHATFRRITDADVAEGVSPVGVPLAGFETRIVDTDGHPADRGELLLAGPQVVHGYLNRPSLTRERFITPDGPDGPVFYHSGDIVERTADGELRYIGRTDDQVKIRGFRIELGEVEAAFTAVDGVGTASAFVFASSGGDELACAYTSTSGAPLDETPVRTALRTRVPEYMVPTRLLWSAELPRNQNGKVDRAVLRASLSEMELEGTRS